MIRLALLVVLVACTSDGADEGTPLRPCQECGPGAVRAGRLFSSLRAAPLAVNPAGTIAGTTEDGLVWLRDDFTLEHSMPLAHAEIEIALDEAGGGVVALLPDIHDPAGPYNPKTVIALAPDHSERWRVYLTVLGINRAFATSELIWLDTAATSGAPEVVALRVADGSTVWRKSLGFIRAFGADNTFIVTGSFSGTLDLGGTAAPLVAIGTDSYVAAIDALTGEARWALRFETAEDGFTHSAPDVGVGSAGEIAVCSYPNANAAASLTLLDSTGTVRWTQPAFETQPTALLPDGDRVLTSRVVTPTVPQQLAIAQYSASGLDWERPITGTGVHSMQLLGLVGDRLIGSIANAPPPSPPSSTTIGDVTIDGVGVAIVELVH